MYKCYTVHGLCVTECCKKILNTIDLQCITYIKLQNYWWRLVLKKDDEKRLSTINWHFSVLPRFARVTAASLS